MYHKPAEVVKPLCHQIEQVCSFPLHSRYPTLCVIITITKRGRLYVISAWGFEKAAALVQRGKPAQRLGVCGQDEALVFWTRPQRPLQRILRLDLRPQQLGFVLQAPCRADNF